MMNDNSNSARQAAQQPKSAPQANRAERRRQARLHRSLGLLPLRLPARDVAVAFKDAERDRAEILHGIYPLLHDRTHGGALMAMTEAVGTLVGSAAANEQHLAEGVEVALSFVRTAAELAFRRQAELRQ